MTGLLANLAALLRSKGALTVLAGVIATGGFVVGSQYAFNVDTPTWKVGDTWHYQVTFTQTFDMPDMPEMEGQSESETETETDEFWMQVVDDSQRLGDVPVYSVAMSDDGVEFDADGGVLTKAGLNPLFPDYSQAYACASDAAVSAGVSSGVPGSTPPTPASCEPTLQELRLFDFPMYPGKSWTVNPEIMFQDVNITATVGDRDVISIPAGDVVAYKISASAAEIKNDEIRTMMEEHDLKWGLDYWYSPDLRWIGRVHFWASGSDPDSGAKVSVEMLIEAISFTNVPNVAPGAPIAPPIKGGTAPGSLVVTLDKNVVNVADGEAVTLTAEGQGLPDGATIAWSVSGPDSAKMEGATVKFTPEMPGVYWIKAVALDQDGKGVAKAKETLVANLETSYEGSYDMLGTWDEYPIDVYSAPTMLMLRFEPRTSTPMLPVVSDPEDDLVLYDEDGEEIARGAEIVLTGSEIGDLGTLLAVVETGWGEVTQGDYALHVSLLFSDEEHMPHDMGHKEGRSIGWNALFPRVQ